MHYIEDSFNFNKLIVITMETIVLFGVKDTVCDSMWVRALSSGWDIISSGYVEEMSFVVLTSTANKYLFKFISNCSVKALGSVL